jgi:hypothetical protein
MAGADTAGAAEQVIGLRASYVLPSKLTTSLAPKFSLGSGKVALGLARPRYVLISALESQDNSRFGTALSR